MAGSTRNTCKPGMFEAQVSRLTPFYNFYQITQIVYFLQFILSFYFVKYFLDSISPYRSLFLFRGNSSSCCTLLTRCGAARLVAAGADRAQGFRQLGVAGAELRRGAGTGGGG